MTSIAAPILAGLPGSFAHSVFHERHPKLIDNVIAAHPYPPAVQKALRQLLDESRDGVIEQLPASAPDRQQWLEWGDGLWSRPWAEAPFLWAESYFYRRLLQAVDYFEPGVWRGLDPFAPTKSAELTSVAVDDEITALTELADHDTNTARSALLLSALWGNQADLSFQLTGSTATRSDRLLVDNSSILWATLGRATDPIVALIADNAGRELLPDLVLIDHLLTNQAHRVVLYVKPHPYYVSDATMTDTLATIGRLCEASAPHARSIGQRLRDAMTTERLVVRTHDFFCAPLPFQHMPAELAADLGTATITVLKGDLNYRRLVGDQHWNPTTSFNERVSYFPSPTIALRTLKSEVIVGLTARQVDDLDATDNQWRTKGEHALIQASTADQ
ncbi:damage-control phosphatase ARMT1 family protein [Nocardia gipuzkoensis]